MSAGETGSMKLPTDPHYSHRFPAAIVSHAVWLYHVFSLSLRNVELLLAERGVAVSYETVRRWCQKCRRALLVVCAAVVPGRAISGTSMRCSIDQIMCVSSIQS